MHDDLGSVSVALSSTGGVTATALYAPYGAGRYSSGTMPISYGYTGQRGDPSGLTYMHARYYDASAGQFVSADGVQGPNRYGYVGGNPETLTDPTGTTSMCPIPLVGIGLRCGTGNSGGKPATYAAFHKILFLQYKKRAR